MKPITYDQWSERFEVDENADADSDIRGNPEEFDFFDNGAVRNMDGDFIIKTDQVKNKP